MVRRDIVTIGASAGGVSALQAFIREFPADLPAAVLIVQHSPGYWPSVLPSLLQKVCALPVVIAENGMRVTPGRVFLPQRDKHLLIDRGMLQIRHGPRQSGARPAIDPLFRSAAVAFHSRVVGVILSGLLDDGAAGMTTIRACGGLCLVQDPTDAEFPDMPRNTLEALGGTADAVLPLIDLARHLVELVGSQVPATLVPGDLAAVVNESIESMNVVGSRNQPVQLSCPECGGAIRPKALAGVEQYQCHVGHTFTPEVLAAEQALQVERALWASIRLLEERGAFLLRLAETASRGGRQRAFQRFHEEAQHASSQAITMRSLLSKFPPSGAQTERTASDG